MKKYVVIEDIGKWERKNGRMVIYGTVLEQKFFTESNETKEVFPYHFKETEYRKDGTWHHYSVYKRAEARRILANYQNKN